MIEKNCSLLKFTHQQDLVILLVYNCYTVFISLFYLFILIPQDKIGQMILKIV